MPIENDAVDDNGCPVLFCLHLRPAPYQEVRYGTPASEWDRQAHLLDFQMDALRKCCEDRAQFQTIGLKNGKGGFVHKTQKIVFDSFWTAAAAFCLTLRRRYIAQFIRNHTVWKTLAAHLAMEQHRRCRLFILSASFEALFTLPYGGLSAASYVSACWCCSLSWLCGWDMGTLENTIRNGILSISKKELTEHRVLCLKRKRRKC